MLKRRLQASSSDNDPSNDLKYVWMALVKRLLGKRSDPCVVRLENNVSAQGFADALQEQEQCDGESFGCSAQGGKVSRIQSDVQFEHVP